MSVRNDNPGLPLVDVDQILTTVPLTDGHNDFAWMIRGWLQNRLDHESGKDLEDMPIGQTDLRRLKKSQIGCQFWSAFVPCPSKDDDFETVPLLDTLRTTLQQLDLLHNMFESYPDIFVFVDRSDDILPASQSGRIASLIGIEGLHQIANSASALRMLHRLGVRYATLCHDANNLYVDSATSEAPKHHGLSTHGHEMIVEMNRVGMMIDLSHTSQDVQRHVLALSTAPVIFSHSSCFALCPHPRNVTDEVLGMLKQNGGVIMICFLPSLIDPSGGRNASLQQVVDHIIYAGTRIGYSHVGIGSDFDGMLKGPKGLDDVTQYPNLVAELAKRGLNTQEISQVLGLNIIRILKIVEETAQGRKQKNSAVLYDKIPQVWTEEQRTILLAAGSIRRGSP